MNAAQPAGALRKVTALLLMLLPSLGLCLALSRGAEMWEALLLGLVAAGMLLALGPP